jgi:hypothetical protein
MKNTQQHLLIQDLDYCNIVCDDAEEIIGGGPFKKLFSAIRDEVQGTVNAVITTAVDLVTTGKSSPTKETVIDLFVPLEVRVLHRLFK